jgi:TonB family protein
MKKILVIATLFTVLSAITSSIATAQTFNDDSVTDNQVDNGFDEPIPYQLIEVKPTFLGGDINKFGQWVLSNIMYPLKAKKQELSGRVVLSFTIEKNGSVTNVKVLRGVHELLDDEAVRIVRESPRWNPGQHHGELSRCNYTLPIIFDLANIQDSGDNNGYYWVDLGLSVRWATSNLGATTPYGYGDFYSWGALSTTYSYSADKSKTFNAPVDNICANPQYDVARLNLKSTWRMPTKEECEELIKDCVWTWTTKNGVSGFEVKSKVNSNSIFLPASGVYESPENNNDTGVLGCYWTSTPADKKYMDSYLKEAFVLRFTSNGPYTLYYNKYFGYNVRPVCD